MISALWRLDHGAVGTMTAVGKRISALALAFALSALAPLSAAGDDAKVLDVKVSAEPGGTYRFDVTVGHADQGWKHYADKFEVMTADGRVLGTRTLLHPHDDEQPFTRELSGVRVPAGIAEVVVRAWDNVHKAGKKTMTVRLPPAK